MNYSLGQVFPHYKRLRRRQFRLCQTFNIDIVNNLAFFPEAPLQNRTLSYSSRTVHKQSLIPIYAHSSQFKYFFFPNVIDHWSSLPERVTSSSSIVSFKYKYLTILYPCSIIYISYQQFAKDLEKGQFRSSGQFRDFDFCIFFGHQALWKFN